MDDGLPMVCITILLRDWAMVILQSRPRAKLDRGSIGCRKIFRIHVWFRLFPNVCWCTSLWTMVEALTR